MLDVNDLRDLDLGDQQTQDFHLAVLGHDSSLEVWPLLVQCGIVDALQVLGDRAVGELDGLRVLRLHRRLTNQLLDVRPLDGGVRRFQHAHAREPDVGPHAGRHDIAVELNVPSDERLVLTTSWERRH